MEKKSSKRRASAILSVILAFALSVSTVFASSCADFDGRNLSNSGEYNDSDGDNSGGSGSNNGGSNSNGSGTNNGGNTNGSGSNNGGNTNGSGTNNGGNTNGSGTNNGGNSNGSGTNGGSNTTVSATYTNPYPSTSAVGFYAEYLGTVKRNIPTETKDEGLVEDGTIPAYPTYGTSLSLTKEQREAIIAENSYISAKGTQYTNGTYDKMDANGYLYLKDGTPVVDEDGNQRQLYKHTASTSMYYGTGISDDEEGIIKRVTLSPRGYGSYSVTGVYAPAGEVVKIQVSEKDLKANGGKITVYIGQVMYSSYPNNIGSGVNPNRMPILVNTMTVSKDTATLEDGVYTAYVGSYLGGPIYIDNTNDTVTLTISGGVRYSHFILGYTTQEEYEANAASSAPYFDMEVRDYGVLHSGPKKYAASFSYDDIYKAAVLWEKITAVSTQGANQGIAILYDTYIVNGYYAVSFVGWRTTILPNGIMANALNYKAFTKSGAWATIHEYNHHFNHWGAGFSGASDEITNNALNMVEYSLFTTISGNRGIGNYGAENLSDWSRYLSATWSLQQILSRVGNTGNQTYYKTSSGLTFYSTLINNIGQDNFMQAKVLQKSDTTLYPVDYNGYLGALTQVTHYNMSYFFNDLLGAGVEQEDIDKYTDSSYPMFVPISCVYQTGRSITYDGAKSYTETMQPYKISYGQEFTIDLSKYTMSSNTYSGGSIVLPDGFSYKVKSVSSPESGSIKKVSDYVYTYTPGSAVKSGKIYVTLQITKDDGAFEVEDVDLVLEFEQSHEITKNTIERTVYSYTDNFYDSETGTFTTTAAEAFENNFEGYVSKVDGDNNNPVNSSGNVIQDCNSDVWFVDKLQNDGDNTNDGVVDENIKTQAVVISGKIYAADEGKYRIALRGRKNVALFISLDGGTTYELAAEYTNATNTANFPNTEGTYKDLDLEAGSWVYFKAVLIRYYGEERGAFIGVGWGEWTEPEEDVTIGTDTDGFTVEDPEAVAGSVDVSYVTAYRTSYVSLPTEEYNHDYLYKRNYSYTYNGVTTYDVDEELVTENCRFNTGWGHDLSGLVDGDSSTYAHTNYAPSDDNPAIVEIKLASEITANRVTFEGSRNSENRFLPKNFKIYVSTDGENWTLACNVTNSEVSSDGWEVTAFLNSTYTFSYYRVEITATHNQYIAIKYIIFEKYDLEIDNGKQITPDDSMFTYVGKWETKQEWSTFGHVYVGKKDATVEFTFEGTRFGILSVADLGTKFKVEIDGKEVSSIDLVANTDIGASFISDKLTNGKHTVKITCLEDDTNIDSIVIW